MLMADGFEVDPGQGSKSGHYHDGSRNWPRVLTWSLLSKQHLEEIIAKERPDARCYHPPSVGGKPR